MSKTILEILGTSTPVSEAIADEIGLVKASIACRVFFYQQLKNGVCSASVNTLAKKLGLSSGAVSGNLKWLIKNEWIVYARPHTKGNATNHYKVSQKFYNTLERSGNESQEVSRSRGESDVHEVNVHVHEVNGKEEVKEEVKEDLKTSGGNLSEIVNIWENNIGFIQPIIREEILSLMDEITEGVQVEWFKKAIQISCEQNKRTLAYVRGILRKWIAKGQMDILKPKRASKNNQHNIAPGQDAVFEGWF